MPKKYSLLILFSFLFFTNFAPAQRIWQKNSYAISLENNILKLSKGEINIAEILSFEFNFIKPESIVVEDIQADGVSLKLIFAESDGFNDEFPKEILLTVSQFNNTFRFFAFHKTFNHVTIKLKDDREHYFGLIEKLYPGNSKNPDLQGNVIDVEVYAQGNQDYAENYASAYSAFYISSKGYGSFFDTFAKGRYHLGINGTTQIYHQTDSLDWYIFYGPTGEKIHREYFNVIGKPKYIPMWACGPIFWRDQNDGGKDEILSDIQKFTDLKIPLTGCFVDRPYSNGNHEWSKMNFNEKFSEPEKWINIINEKYGLQFMTWVGPMTFADTVFPGLLTGYFSYIDLTNPAALHEFENRLKNNQYSAGVKGHKMDRSDEHFPFTDKWYEPITESESRNKYVYLYSKVIGGFLQKYHDKDQFNFARAAYHRTQPYLSALWGGDSRNNWHGMAGNMANAVRCGFMGFPMWGSDTGGYLGEGKIDEELFIRWLQWSAWCGMFEIKIDGAGGQGEDRAPWNYSRQLQDIFKNAAELRMNMLSYIYSCVNTSSSNGVLMKPLTYLYPDDANTYKIWDEYIFGNSFLVAPVFSKEKKREVYLPSGTWYDFYNLNNKYQGPVRITYDVGLKNIPVFIKENSIYVSGNIYQGNSKNWMNLEKENEEVTIHLFPGQNGEEAAFTYIDYFDNDAGKEMKLIAQEDKLLFTSAKLKSSSKIEIKSDNKPKLLFLSKRPVEFEFNEQNKVVIIEASKETRIELVLQY